MFNPKLREILLRVDKSLTPKTLSNAPKIFNLPSCSDAPAPKIVEE